MSPSGPVQSPKTQDGSKADTWIALEYCANGGGVLYETDGFNAGTKFPYGAQVRYPCDEHRRDYTFKDAAAVAQFVSLSSWITRKGR